MTVQPGTGKYNYKDYYVGEAIVSSGPAGILFPISMKTMFH